MSVVVQMEMPQRCEDCPFRDMFLCCCCTKERKYTGSSPVRPDWCPIVCSLPEGHGRLVDADKLADDMKARKALFGRRSDPNCIVEDAPTIVPADEYPAYMSQWLGKAISAERSET